MYVKRGFEVKVSKGEVVAAPQPMQEHRLPLSNLDLLLPPVDFGVFFVYNCGPVDDFSFAQTFRVLKNSLAQTLVSYYAFAGELVKNGAGEPELVCNNGGVDFVEAYADVELKDFDFYNPDDAVQGKLVPERKRGVLAVQATQLGGGGLVVACTFSHQVADAYSANMFLVSWAETANQSKPVLSRPPPSFCRSLLLPRRPGAYHQSVDDMYVPVSALPADHHHQTHQSTASRIYYIKAHHLNKLQELANVDNNSTCRRTKLEAFCAFLWKLISVSGAGENICRLGIVVDGRSRLMDCNIASSYLGNVLSVPFGEKKTEEIKGKPLNWVANEVHAFVQSAATKEHFLGLIDWVEEHRPEVGVPKVYTEEQPAVVVSSGRHFPVREMDYGWGSPVFGSYHVHWRRKSGYVMPMPSPRANGDWIVYMHLIKGQLEAIETNAPHIFNPLTFDYLVSNSSSIL